MTYLEELNTGLRQVLSTTEDVVLFGEDLLDPYGGAFKVTRGLQHDFPRRVLTTPISEAALTGMATGMALRGLRPVLEIMFGDFMGLCMDQILNHASKFRMMYNDQVKIPITIRTPMGGGRGYGPTHSQCIEKLFLGIPDIRIVAPSIFCEVAQLLKQAIFDDRPVLFIEHKLLYSAELLTSSVPGLLIENKLGGYGYPVSVIRNYTSGSPDVTLITYGGASRFVPTIFQHLAEEEVRAVACIPALIKPPPFQLIEELVAESGRAVIVEEGIVQWGWGAELAARLHDSLFGKLTKPVRRIGALDTIIPASKTLEQAVLPSSQDIEKALLEMVE
ncbi:MAG: transketolase C-terminal domain-containing protein [Candidatus Acidiferrales bacterium]